MSPARVPGLPPLGLIEQELGRRSLAAFARMAWPLVEPANPLIWGAHLDALCAHLEAVSRGQIRHLLVTLPPRHCKSTLFAVLWPAWVWTWAPHVRFLTGSHSADLAIRDAVRSRRVIESAWYVARWGLTCQMASDQNVKARYENTALGYRLATSVGGATGEGGDVVLVDDPHHLDDAFSEAARERVKNWWDSTMSGRVNDPRRSARVLVQQRVHEDDLAAHVLARDPHGWAHVNLPAVAEPLALRPGPTPIGWTDTREEGALLWPERFGPEEVEQRKLDLGPALWAAQDQQRPAPLTGVIYAPEGWGYWEALPPEDDWDDAVLSWDLAFEDAETSSWVVGQAWARVGATRYLVDQVRGRWDFTRTLEQVAGLMAAHPRCRPVVIENRANGPALISTLTQAVPELRDEMLAYVPKGSKEQRAWAQQPLQHAGRLLLPRHAGWVGDFVEEHRRFPRASADDQVDAQSQANAVLTDRQARKRSAASVVGAVRRSISQRAAPIDRLRRPGSQW